MDKIRAWIDQGNFSPAALTATMHVADYAHPAEVMSKPPTVDQPAPGVAEPPGSFAADIRPIFAARCVQCHGPDVQQNDLRLDTLTGVLKGSVNGQIVFPGGSDKESDYSTPDGPTSR